MVRSPSELAIRKKKIRKFNRASLVVRANFRFKCFNQTIF